MHEKLEQWMKQIEDVEKTIQQIARLESIVNKDKEGLLKQYKEIEQLREVQQHMKLEFIYTWILVQEGVI